MGLDLNANVHLWIQHYHSWTYGILFAILFCETGLVFLPILPGDTLLFAAGLVSRADGSRVEGLNIGLVLLVLTIAPIAGDNVNYFFGRWLGPVLFRNPKSKIFKKENLDKTHEFFVKYGPKAVILARWVPVVRTFSPFVAGMGAMPYRRFLGYSIAGGCLWVWTLTLIGYLLGGEPWIQQNLAGVMAIMIVVTGGPIIFEFLKQRRLALKANEDKSASPESEPAEPALK